MTIYRTEMVEKVAKECGQTKKMVRDIIKAYTEVLCEEVKAGYNVKFLHLFNIEKKGGGERLRQGMICEKLEVEKGYKSKEIQDILTKYEECILEELDLNSSVSIYGVAKLYKVPKLRIRKSGRLANSGYRVKATRSFRERINK